MTTPEIPTGHWTIDAGHSEVGFSVRHLAVAKVKGYFDTFEGAITIAENPLESRVQAEIDLSSINTRDARRDEHLRSADFFDVETHPKMTFTSTSVTPEGSDYRVAGDLTVGATTHPVTIDLEFNGVGPDPWGGTRGGFSATTEISRKAFGIDFDVPMDGGGVVVGDKIRIFLEVEAVLQGADTPVAS